MRRTSPVRVLCVVGSPFALHTGRMASDTQATAFVTEAGGFIGPERASCGSDSTSLMVGPVLPDYLQSSAVRSVSNGLRRTVTAPASGESFAEVVLPHLRAAHRLARSLMGNEHDAEDAVQEASLRAFRYFRTFTGGNGRAWFLRIVRNICSGWRGRSFQAPADPFDENQHSSAQPASDPETLLLHTDGVALIERAMSSVPDRYRELLVLRELKGLSYQELAAVLGIPMGTVMSGLSRGRQAFRRALDYELKRSGISTSPHPREPEPDEDPSKSTERTPWKRGPARPRPHCEER